jgi:sec-independent protein translocase protein TatA
MFEPSWEKLLIVLVIALVVLGPKKLPEVGRSLGRGIREFKDGVTGKEDEHPPSPVAALQAPPLSAAHTPAAGERVSTHSE